MFFLNGDVLYKRNYNTVLLRCMDRHATDMFIKEVQEGSFITHANEYTMAKKILKVGYYWLTMESDYFGYVKKFHKMPDLYE